MLAFGETSVDRQFRRGVFPFGFAGQPRSAPPRIGIGLEIADMHHGLLRLRLAECRLM